MNSTSHPPPSSSSSHREKFLLKVISPAIRGQSCPICLKDLADHRRVAVIAGCLHSYCLRCIRKWSDLKRKCPLCNADFDSLFYNISFSHRSFLRKKLPAPEGKGKGKTVINEDRFSSLSLVPQRRMSRSRPLPWRRTFGRPGFVPCDVIAERKLQWRASVYKRGLQAVRSSVKNCIEQNIPREKVLQRIEPWIQRELKAILEDPDPSVIVHVASSLYIAFLEGKFEVSTIQLSVEYQYHSLAPLQRFLHKWTNLFWHELSCFAESSLNMETYDAVVTYKKSA